MRIYNYRIICEHVYDLRCAGKHKVKMGPFNTGTEKPFMKTDTSFSTDGVLIVYFALKG